MKRFTTVRVVTGELVSLLRTRAGLTRRELARDAGLSLSRLERIETGLVTTSLEDILRLEEVLRAYGVLITPGEITSLLIGLIQLLELMEVEVCFQWSGGGGEYVDRVEVRRVVSALVTPYTDNRSRVRAFQESAAEGTAVPSDVNTLREPKLAAPGRKPARLLH